MCSHDPARDTIFGKPSHEDHDRERRLELLVRRLPPRLQRAVRRLRRPSLRPLRIAVGILLVLGSLLAILPVFGLWMLPVGLVLLAEDFHLLRKPEARILSWIERRRPHWMGLPAPRKGTPPNQANRCGCDVPRIP